MKNLFKSFLVVLITAGLVYAAGHYAPYGYRYIPQLTTQGTTDYAQIVASETATDALLNKFSSGFYQVKAIGNPGYDDLPTALTAIGSTPTLLVLPSGVGSITVAANTTIPSNIALEIDNGSSFAVANGYTLTIQGPIAAGPYRIFSGTGAIDLTKSPTKRCYLQWWGATPGTVSSGADISPPLLKAYQSLTDLSGTVPCDFEIVVTNGFWWLNSNMTYAPSGTTYLPSLVGESRLGSVIVMNVGGNTDGICIGGSSGWIYSAWIRNLTVYGVYPNSCRHAFNLQAWNSYGGMKNVGLLTGSTASALFVSSVENCTWDISTGPGSKFTSFPTNYAVLEAAPILGVGYNEGMGTYNYIRIEKTGAANEVWAVKLSNSWGVTIDSSTMEGSGGGEVQSSYTNNQAPFVPMYSGGITRVGQTCVAPASGEIDNFNFGLVQVGSPTGTVTGNIYATSGGVPTGSPIYTSWVTLKASSINGGNAFTYWFPTAMRQLTPGTTYYVDVEYSGGDSSNYVGVSYRAANASPLYVGANPTTCYTYSGGTWTPQTYYTAHAINSRASVWLYDCNSVKVRRAHQENSGGHGFLLDLCENIEIEGGEGDLQVYRSNAVTLSGASEYSTITTDPYSSINFTGSNQIQQQGMAGAMSDAGYTMYNGIFINWPFGIPDDIKGNNTNNLLPNNLLDRWQTSMPDGGWSLGGTTMVQAGTGKSDTTRHPLTPYCNKVTYNSTSQTNWGWGNLTGELVNMCKGRWMTWGIYMMFPSGQTFSTNQYLSGALTLPAWAPSTQYNIGDGFSDVNGTFAVCVQPGISGSGSRPVLGTAAPPTYTVDGTVVWLACNPAVPQGFDSSYSDNIWRRIFFSSYVPTNATAAFPLWQWYGQASTASTAYFALPTLNFGKMPCMAPQPIALWPVINASVVGTNLDCSDSVIPTNSGSKLYNYWGCVGDHTRNTGVTTSTSPGWTCTTPGNNNGNSPASTWTADPNL